MTTAHSEREARADVVVIGGGLIGLSVAWRAAIKGLEVAVVDDAPGRGASHAGAGMLAPVTEVRYGEEALLELGMRSLDLYPSFVSELESASNIDVGYTRCGTLVVAKDNDENVALDELFVFQQKLNLKVERLKARELRALEPALAPTVRGGVLVEGDDQVDNRALVAALERACGAEGVRFVSERVDQVVVQDGAATGVELSGGRTLRTDWVVVAAGCWSGSIGGLTGLLPVRPVKGQILYLKAPDGRSLIEHNVRSVDCYLVSRPDGRLVVGATVEDQGFDRAVTAGAVYTLLRDAYELVPGITEAELVEAVAGLRPGSPDNMPLLGRTSVDNVIAATGHYRSGILLAPVTAELIAALLADGSEPEELGPFSPRRFEGTMLR